MHLSLVAKCFTDILKDKYNNNLTIQTLVQAQSYKSKRLQNIVRVEESMVGKTLVNGCQFANIFPHNIITPYSIRQTLICCYNKIKYSVILL